MIGSRLWQIVGWTMLHYFWVGAALGAVAFLVRRRLRSAAANVRYLFALGSLLLLSVAPAAIALVVMQKVVPRPRYGETLLAELAVRPEAGSGGRAAADGERWHAIARGGCRIIAPVAACAGQPQLLAVLNLAAMWLALALGLRRAADVRADDRGAAGGGTFAAAKPAAGRRPDYRNVPAIGGLAAESRTAWAWPSATALPPRSWWACCVR